MNFFTVEEIIEFEQCVMRIGGLMHEHSRLCSDPFIYRIGGNFRGMKFSRISRVG